VTAGLAGSVIVFYDLPDRTSPFSKPSRLQFLQIGKLGLSLYQMSCVNNAEIVKVRRMIVLPANHLPCAIAVVGDQPHCSLI
jgi:hypothetical protein